MPDLETVARSRRVQDLCRELRQLVTLSLEQRRVIDRLLMQLDAVTRYARSRTRPLKAPEAAATPGRLSDE